MYKMGASYATQGFCVAEILSKPEWNRESKKELDWLGGSLVPVLCGWVKEIQQEIGKMEKATNGKMRETANRITGL